MEHSEGYRNYDDRNPLIASLTGGFCEPGPDGQESTEESMRYPPEIMRGFTLGALLGALLIAAVLWLLRQAFFGHVAAEASQPGTPGFWLFWIAAGLLTALLVTGAFLLVSAVQVVEVLWKPSPTTRWIPATGEDEEKTDQDEPEE